MESTNKLRKFLGASSVMEESKASESKYGHDDADDGNSGDQDTLLQVGDGNIRVQAHDHPMKPASPNQMNLNFNNKELTTKIESSSPDQYESGSSSSAKKEQMDEKLETAKAEIDEVMEENQRLRTYLERILKDYRTLQMQYRDFIQQEDPPSKVPNILDDTQEPEFIALSLGRTSSGTIKVEPHKSPVNEKVEKESLTLGLDCRSALAEPSPNPSPENSVEEVNKEEVEQTSPHNKTMKNGRDVADDDISLQNPTKRARVSVRVRCDTPSMNDGCQWRKYGQKIAKGNPCPRAYYRCTVAPSCPVRKQVQRCAEDMSILITTYEGTHNHPLPASATAMASTTSAAASMLLSGSTTSGSGSTGPSSSSIPANLNGLNFYLSDNSRPKSIYLSNSSISSTPSFPTITLDLTSTQYSSSSSHLTRPVTFPPPRHSTTNLNFNSLESSTFPISWSNGMLTNNYNASQHQPFNKNFQNIPNSLNFGSTQPNESFYQSYLKQTNHQTLASDSIAAASKAIASDPSFQSALVAALSSLIGSTAATNTPSIQENTKSSDPFPILSSFPSTTNNATKCIPSFLSNSSSSNSTQPASLMFISPSFPFSNSKRKSNSPGDNNRDHVI